MSYSGEGDSKEQAVTVQHLCCEVMVELSTSDEMINDVLLPVDTDQPLAVHACIFRLAEICR